MADLGNLTRTMRLQCHRCGWPPPDDMRMDHARLHFQVDHDTDEVKFDLMPVCSCGEAMTFTESRPAGGLRSKDYFTCGVCGNTGHLYRDEVPAP
jgi:hypothetical protein